MGTGAALIKTETLKLVYLAYFHSIMSHVIIFWGTSTDSKNILCIQRSIIRIMAGTKGRASCREFSLSLLFAVDNKAN
jgi:hypothetical protein